MTAWASVQHFRTKISERSSAQRSLGAAMTDVVFLDHMCGRPAASQAYAVQNGVIDQMVDYRYGRVNK